MTLLEIFLFVLMLINSLVLVIFESEGVLISWLPDITTFWFCAHFCCFRLNHVFSLFFIVEPLQPLVCSRYFWSTGLRTRQRRRRGFWKGLRQRLRAKQLKLKSLLMWSMVSIMLPTSSNRLSSVMFLQDCWFVLLICLFILWYWWITK